MPRYSSMTMDVEKLVDAMHFFLAIKPLLGHSQLSEVMLRVTQAHFLHNGVGIQVVVEV